MPRVQVRLLTPTPKHPSADAAVELDLEDDSPMWEVKLKLQVGSQGVLRAAWDARPTCPPQRAGRARRLTLPQATAARWDRTASEVATPRPHTLQELTGVPVAHQKVFLQGIGHIVMADKRCAPAGRPPPARTQQPQQRRQAPTGAGLTRQSLFVGECARCAGAAWASRTRPSQDRSISGCWAPAPSPRTARAAPPRREALPRQPLAPRLHAPRGGAHECGGVPSRAVQGG